MNLPPLAAFQGAPLTVQVRAPDGSVQPFALQVRAIPARDYPQYLQVVNDELRAAEFVTGQPRGWADTLTPESLGELIELSEEINLGFFSWVQRARRRAERLMPGMTERAVREAIRSDAGSAAPPSSAG
jgi:hypothetical protein